MQVMPKLFMKPGLSLKAQVSEPQVTPVPLAKISTGSPYIPPEAGRAAITSRGRVPGRVLSYQVPEAAGSFLSRHTMAIPWIAPTSPSTSQMTV